MMCIQFMQQLLSRNPDKTPMEALSYFHRHLTLTYLKQLANSEDVTPQAKSGYASAMELVQKLHAAGLPVEYSPLLTVTARGLYRRVKTLYIRAPQKKLLGSLLRGWSVM